ncbi:adipocyte plasma membrane-associated protein-like [Dorcoceras hygrometricum]|uniref:Adipocyte plasma membrane-associated protein-like n=1 Tax=Dorcoceras hygrometricum TaxID=472368 RepID=A0A2Z7AIP5_9LAMI|nr:adipocyte plasma membrane-associated protein-like [Dorcoceras hygrometricum]
MVADQGQFVAGPVAPQAAQPCANRCTVARRCVVRLSCDDAREAAAGREGLCGDGARWPTRLIAPPCCPSCALDVRASRPWLRRLLFSSCDDGAWSAAHVAAARAFCAARNFCAAACRPPLRRCSGEFPVMS